MKYSIIVPTYNRPNMLVRCLDGLMKLNYSSWEAIIVNDGGNSSFDGIDYTQYPEHFKFLSAPHAGPATARNFGAKHAQGDILAFIDDDCIVSTDWLTQFDVGFDMLECHALGGEWLNPYPNNSTAVAWQLYMSFFREYLVDTTGNNLLLLSNNVAYQKQVFNMVGGFDETFPLAAAEDLDISHRLVEQGCHQKVFTKATVWHHHPLTMINFLKQQYRYGRGSAYFMQKTYNINWVQHYRGEFFFRLASFLTHHRATPTIWLLLILTQFAHKLGKLRETQNIRRGNHIRSDS